MELTLQEKVIESDFALDSPRILAINAATPPAMRCQARFWCSFWNVLAMTQEIIQRKKYSTLLSLAKGDVLAELGLLPGGHPLFIDPFSPSLFPEAAKRKKQEEEEEAPAESEDDEEEEELEDEEFEDDEDLDEDEEDEEEDEADEEIEDDDEEEEEEEEDDDDDEDEDDDDSFDDPDSDYDDDDDDDFDDD